ncbi:MAG: COG4315 family predicted lipoprotein [Solirubrobacteraceae bacterium]
MAIATTSKLRTGAAAAAIGAALALAACGGSGSGSGASGATSPSGSATATAAAATGAAISVRHGSDGAYLTGASGRALYLWMADSRGHSRCSGACAQVWPPVLSKNKPIAGHGAVAADLGTIARSGGQRQVTYNGHPLYYYVADSRAGSITGEGSNGFGAKWWLVSPSGAAITHGHSGTAASGGSSGSSGGGGWG